ncbi:hypothetical protein BGZ98_000513 [Dissophora globulifera]|nr:hypothetical protein BGZ98_000513 [Dissophora globulifera]
MRHQPNAPRKVIAVDLDEVLARTSLAIAEFHNDTYGTSLTMEDFVSYDYTKIWGGTREESIVKWRLFFDSPYFLKVEPVEGSLETLKLLKSRRYSLVIVTARQQFVADLTKKFVDRHFPGIFESIYFANHYLTEQEKMTFVSKPKSVICRDVHAELLIDDSLENAAEVARAGIPVLLFDLQGAYKWNKLEDGQQLPEKVTRVQSWKEVQSWFPRPRSPLSNLIISRSDQMSDEDEASSEEEEEEEEEDEEQLYGVYHHKQSHRRHNMDSDSGSDEDLDGEAEEEDMGEMAKREQEEEEEEEHHGRTLRRRRLMMMDFSSSEDDEDIDLEQGETMDNDEQDFDLESGHGSRQDQLHRQDETMCDADEDSMDIETVMETGESTVFVQVNDDSLESDSLLSMTTTATTTSSSKTVATAVVSITAAAQVDYRHSELSAAIPTSPDSMTVEGLMIKSPAATESLVSSLLLADKRSVEMEEIPLA